MQLSLQHKPDFTDRLPGRAKNLVLAKSLLPGMQPFEQSGEFRCSNTVKQYCSIPNWEMQICFYMTSASREVQLEERNIIVIFAAWSLSVTMRNSIIRSSIIQSIHVLYSRCMAGTFCIADQTLSRRESLFTLTCQKSENATLQKIGVRIFGIIFEAIGNRRGKRRACISIPEKIHNISLNVNLAKYRGVKSRFWGQKSPLGLSGVLSGVCVPYRRLIRF